MGRVSHSLDGEQLLRLRAERGLSQQQLASDAGVSKRTIERAEAGHRISGMNCGRIASALDVPLPELVARRESVGGNSLESDPL